MRSPTESGQATVEFVLCLPLVGLLVALVIQVGIVSVDNGRLWHAAREAARVAAVDADKSAVEQAAESSGLSPLEVSVDPEPSDRALGAPVTVTVSHAPGVSIPLLGRVLAGIDIRASATMRIETP